MKPPLVVLHPARVSQHTCMAYGFKSARAFLEFIARNQIPHVRIGKTIFARAQDLDAAFERLQSEPAQADDELPETAESFLARRGFVVGK